jgi:hypothetical protein
MTILNFTNLQNILILKKEKYGKFGESKYFCPLFETKLSIKVLTCFILSD